MRFPSHARRTLTVVIPSLPACLLAAGGQAVAEDSLPGWPAYLNAVHATFSPPAAGDIDGDGDLEILATVGIPLFGGGVVEGIWAFHHDGVEVIDGDLNPATKGVFRALDFSSNFQRTPVTLGNLDDDPALEIVCLGPHLILALNGDGSPVPGWPVGYPGGQKIDEFNRAPIMIADLDVDGDGLVEILGAEVPSNLEKRLFFWDGDGTELLADSLFATTPGEPVVELVLRRGILGDFDRDGRLDYGSALRRGELHLASFRASALSPLYRPQYGWTCYRFDVQRTGVWHP